MSESTDLNEEEVALAELIAQAQWRRARDRRARTTHGEAPAGTAESLWRHQTGALGEVAVAKLLDLYPNLSTFEEEKARGGYDFPHRIGVRATRGLNGLRAHPEDPPEGRYVAALVQGSQVIVLGWDDVETVQQDGWWTEPQAGRPCYLKPERFLQPLSNLRVVIAKERAEDAGTTYVPSSRRTRGDDSWLCTDCRRQVALRDGLCGKCWLTQWKTEQEVSA